MVEANPPFGEIYHRSNNTNNSSNDDGAENILLPFASKNRSSTATTGNQGLGLFRRSVSTVPQIIS